MQEAVSLWIARIGAPAFRRIWRYDRALRRKLTPAGWMVLGAGVAAAVFGFNTREALIYQLFGLAVGLIAIAAAASLRLKLDVTAARELPRVATAGVPFEYTLSLRNAASRDCGALVVEDALAVPRPDPRAFAAYKVSEDRSRNLFDRLVGYPRWIAYMRNRIGATIEPALLAGVPARAAATVRLRCTPLRRGVLEFEAVRFARVEPLGLMKAGARRALPATLLVMPRLHPVAALHLPGTRRLQPGGIAFAGRVGDAEEFVSLRDYRAGDSPRRIHWKAWARTGRLVVKEYQDEFFVRHALVLDTFGNGSDECFEAAVSLAASLVMMPRGNESLLDLMFVEERAYTLTQGRGLGAAGELLRVLAAVAATPGGDFAPLADAVALGAGRMSGTICVLLAWDEPRRRMVAGLRARGIPVRVWVVTDEAGTLDPGPLASDPGSLRRVDPRNLAAELMRP